MGCSWLSKYFKAHGHFCASHPWEVIMAIIGVCALSLSVGKVSAEPRHNKERLVAVTLSVVNCMAIVYIYKQFSSLLNEGSRYFCGIIGIFFIFFSSVFGTLFILSGPNNALSFFLLFVDISKAISLAKAVFKSRTKDEMRENMGKGMASFGPTMTLDAVLKMLLISIGTISGVPRLEAVCYLGCISIMASYLIFMTLFPASLALILEIHPSISLDNFVRDLLEEERNPVAQQVKGVMTLGLALVHLHSRFLFSATGWHVGSSSMELEGDATKGDAILVDGWKMSIDQLFPIILAIILSTHLFIRHETSSSKPDLVHYKSCSTQTELGASNSTQTDLEQSDCTLTDTGCASKSSQIEMPAVEGRIEERVTDPWPNQVPPILPGVQQVSMVPVGCAGPLLLDGVCYYVPMATTEGALVASTNRGCKAVASAGIHSIVQDNGMICDLIVKLPSVEEAGEFKVWLASTNNFQLISKLFDSASQFCKLENIQSTVVWQLSFVTFKACSGDAMGMDIFSKGVDRALEFMKKQFSGLRVVSLVHKQPSAKLVVCEAVIPAQEVRKVLKTTVEKLVGLNVAKNLVGSAMAGSIGGSNAQAANIVTAIFIATGQDLTQNVTSSNCTTLMTYGGPSGKDLHISCVMPSIDVGTIGGGTTLPPQAACLEMLGVRGPNLKKPGENAAQLARIVCGTVLAGELSLMSAQVTGDLVKSHLKLNRIADSSEASIQSSRSALLRDQHGLLSDQEVANLVRRKHIRIYELETILSDFERAVSIRRQVLTQFRVDGLANLPFLNYPVYPIVHQAGCENVIGYMPVPVDYAGPLLLDGVSYHVPMATTEDGVAALTSKGCQAVASAGGIHSIVEDIGMTRCPAVRLPSAVRAREVKEWIDAAHNFNLLEEVFNSTSRFARLKSIRTIVVGRLLYTRFKSSTGDAMGMNMISKGVEKTLEFMKQRFSGLEIVSISINYCTDKKPSAINWVLGRGKLVICEATISALIVRKTLKTTVKALMEAYLSKVLVGPSMAGSIGGFNIQARHIVPAVFIATGQDPAQNVASSNCITLMEYSGSSEKDLYISCVMPSIEVGTVGGGTTLPPQAAYLEMLGVRGAHQEKPGENATRLARVVCGTVLAGELSKLAATSSAWGNHETT